MSTLRKTVRPTAKPPPTARRQVGRSVSLEPAPAPKVLYRVACEDEDGNRYTVIVREKLRLFRRTPDGRGRSTVSYSLNDASPVLFADDETFEIVGSGKLLRRCE